MEVIILELLPSLWKTTYVFKNLPVHAFLFILNVGDDQLHITLRIH